MERLLARHIGEVVNTVPSMPLMPTAWVLVVRAGASELQQVEAPVEVEELRRLRASGYVDAVAGAELVVPDDGEAFVAATFVKGLISGVATRVAPVVQDSYGYRLGSWAPTTPWVSPAA